ncbi:MAG: helix-turn-helix domain-containing protein [Terracidiphilus sp.]
MAVQQNTRTQRRLFRIPKAAEYLGGAVKVATLRQWIWRRQIEHVHIGRSVCIPQDVLDRLIDAGTVPARKARR